MRFLIAGSTALLLCLSFASPLHAELGDYSAFRTFLNRFLPRPADNPVSAEQRSDVWPMLPNPEGFEDGFDPAVYRQWQTVQLHPDTGAVCGNGSPYKIFVNRVPNSSNMVVFLEPGGACWDYDGCTGGSLGARNPNGVPDDYMSLQNPSASLVSPFVFRLNPFSRNKVQDWTIVYMPYCTGDIFSGDRIAVYENPDPAGDPLVFHHNGLRNGRAVVGWLKDNLERPAQMLATGCSAGGAGALTSYFQMRRDMEPDASFLIDDSGPIFPAVADDGSGNPSPSYPLHERIIESWGLDADGGEGLSALAFLEQQMDAFDASDMGTLMEGLAEAYPDDRLSMLHFWQDYNYSRYSYEKFYDYIHEEDDAELRKLYTLLLWHSDTDELTARLSGYDNFGYYFPNFRDLNDSHCATIVDFRNGDIQELGLELDDFIDDVLDGSGPVMKAVETDWSLDPAKPPDLLYLLLKAIGL